MAADLVSVGLLPALQGDDRGVALFFAQHAIGPRQRQREADHDRLACWDDDAHLGATIHLSVPIISFVLVRGASSRDQ